MASEAASAQSYCADQARRYDWDRFICTLFAPFDRRPALLALLAFNVEIARTRAVVSERLLGEIRLQWWRDAVAALYDGGTAAPKHPVIEELKPAIAAFALERRLFETMIDARSDELDGEPAADLAALAKHAHAAEGTLVKLQMRVLGAGAAPPEPALHTADDVAFVASVAALLRARRAGAGFAEQARERLAAARLRARRIDRRYLPALLPAALAEADIEGRDVSRLRRQLAVALKALRGKF